MIRQMTEAERIMLNNRHPYDDDCDCPQCKGTRRRQEAMDYLNEQDDDSDEYYRWDNGTFVLVE